MYNAKTAYSSECYDCLNVITFRDINIRLILLTFFTMLLGCTEAEKASTPVSWWEPLKPDVVIGNDEFYGRNCAITQVSNKDGAKTASVIFKVPYSLIATCNNKGPLQYDGEYIILSVCEMTFGAGGCGGGRYRSADFENWEEYFGVTWIKSEEYEAWRKVGSTSSKADSVKKVVKE